MYVSPLITDHGWGLDGASLMVGRAAGDRAGRGGVPGPRGEHGHDPGPPLRLLPGDPAGRIRTRLPGRSGHRPGPAAGGRPARPHAHRHRRRELGRQPRVSADADGAAVLYSTVRNGVRDRHIGLVTFGKPGVEVVWSQSQGAVYQLQITDLALTPGFVSWNTITSFGGGGSFVHQRARSGGDTTTTRAPRDTTPDRRRTTPSPQSSTTGRCGGGG
jgi:hypothetical protein